MKVAVVGAGAMGSIYAGLLADAGNDVWVVDIWRDHIQAIQQNGLRVEGASGDRLVRLHATTNPKDVGPCDLIIVATKSSGVAGAAEAAKTMLRDNTAILTIQNGLGAAERIAKWCDQERILIGVAGGFGASMRAPGHAHHNGMELVRLGEMNGGTSERLERIATLWRDAGFNVGTYADIDQLIWEKFICNVTFGGTCTVLNMTVGEVMANKHARAIALSCGLEAYDTGRAKGINFSFADAEGYIEKFSAGIQDAKPSMLQDHLAKRRSEIDAINGMVPIVAKEVGLTAPTNAAIANIIKARETTF